ncbi:uncharacterized protein LOC135593212 isoform X2 [Musa acuminata AAA Group]|uniref:uncharacterized protein LOC135593212 isoform X2 n=1 Tax=Musa acuminata AAA Group TaxID=214697 RepID=UPI0031CF7FCC
MEIAAFGSHGSVRILWNSHSSIDKPNWICHSNSAWKRIIFPKAWVSQAQKGSLLKRLKASERTADLTSNVAASENSSQGPLEKKAVWKSTFPNGFEELVLTVCDETSIAELSMKVGTFRIGTTLKGKKQPPCCEVGDMIKEGQAIGFLDQFGNELPIRSNVAGEVLKILCKDGEAVGYGDALIAVLPFFAGIE